MMVRQKERAFWLPNFLFLSPKWRAGELIHVQLLMWYMRLIYCQTGRVCAA